MKTLTVAIAIMVSAGSANASTKFLECKQSDSSGVVQLIFAAVDDDSDKAEVKLYAVTAECAKDDSCGTDVYDKVILPSVLRLTFSSVVDKVVYEKVIYIDRAKLSVVTRSSLRTPVGNSDKTFFGQCELKKVDQSEKVL
jgi:hypothetical protein